MIEFYTTSSPSAPAMRAGIMLEECQLPYGSHKIEVGKGATKPVELLKLNPQGTIPVLFDPNGPDGKSVTVLQSGAIMLYLADKTGKFLPKDANQRALAYQWLMNALTDVQFASLGIYLAEVDMPEKVPSVATFFENSLVKQFRIFDERLGVARFLAGDEFSIADMALYPLVVNRRAIVDKTNGLANLKRWASEVGARPAVQRALTGRA